MLDVEVCLRDRKYEGFWEGLEVPFCGFVQLEEAGSFGGGMLSYFLRSSFWEFDSGNWEPLRFRLNFLRRTELEKEDSGSEGLSVLAGLGAASGFGVTEKLGARGPFGLAWLGLRFSSVIKLGLIYDQKSSLLFGNEDDTKGEIFLSLFPVSKVKDGRLGLRPLGGRSSSERSA